MNMLVLWQMGNLIENHIGQIRYLLLYFVGGVLTSFGVLFYMYFRSDWANVVGASGAICVLMGYFALKVKEERSAIIIWILLISFAPAFLGIAIAWYAHIIGFVLGWLLGYIL
jgi:membrane associated rhomboid family serine protease